MIDKKRVPVLLGAVLVTAVLAFLARDALREPQIVRAVPKAIETLAARPVSLPGGAIRDLGKPPGKLLVLHFWATWCPPCVEEFPSLLAFWKEVGKNPNVELLAVSVDEEWKTVDDWMKKVGAGGIPLALDPMRTTATAFGTVKFPETYVLSSSGEIVEKFIGPLQWTSPAFRKEFDKVLKASAALAAPPGAKAGG
jgi:thiol-disulfide isomerase/thioredoxin